MRRSPLLFSIFAVAFGLLCIRLGFWQISRLHERRASNALVAARLDSAVVTRDQLPGDTALARFRRVRLTGTYDYDHEIVLSGRSKDGSPGVNLLTPLRMAGNDTAVLVNRGWVYSPDALLIDEPHWREPATAVVDGFVTTFHDRALGAAVVPAQARTIRWLDVRTIDSLLPYPSARYYVIASDSATSRAAPVRIDPPALDEGSHLSYAIQWFSFAAIALAGAGVFWWSTRRAGRQPRRAPPAPPLPQ
jgi:surfeit locus 1 family protein